MQKFLFLVDAYACRAEADVDQNDAEIFLVAAQNRPRGGQGSVDGTGNHASGFLNAGHHALYVRRERVDHEAVGFETRAV